MGILFNITPFFLKAQIDYRFELCENLDFKETILKDGSTYIHFTTFNLSLIDIPGYPALPVKYVKFVLPQNTIATQVIAKQTKQKIQKLTKLIEPAQQIEPDSVSFIAPNSDIYTKDELFPSMLVDIVSQGSFRGSTIVTLAIYPCQYNPNKNELITNTSIDLVLKYKTLINGIQKPFIYSQKNIELLSSLVENKSDINKFYNLDKTKNIKNPYADNSALMVLNSENAAIPVNSNYVVVTTNALAPAFNEFMSWKRRKGLKIQLITIEEIKTKYTGDLISNIYDDAGKLRQFLIDVYNNGNGIEYALLAGDKTSIPIRYGFYMDNINPNNGIPTDLYFSDLNGNWNKDGDQRYGEPNNDNVDYFPEIFVGRLIAISTDEILNWVRKVLIYEQNPGNGNNSYLTKLFLTEADEMQQGSEADYVASKATWFTTKTLWHEEDSACTTYVPYFPKGSDVINEFNKHYGLCSFIGHGSPDNVAVASIYLNSSSLCSGTGGYNGPTSETKYKVTTFDNITAGCCEISEPGNGFDNMTNYNYPSIYYSVSCLTMPFDNYLNIPRNMAECYTVINKGGGPAYIGNTRNGQPSSSSNLFGKFLDEITINANYNIGVAEAFSKINSPVYKYLRYSHNLIGDPEMEIWTAVPAYFYSVTKYESGNNVTVNTGGVTGCKICLMSATDNGRNFYQVVENVSTYTFQNVTKPYIFTITKHNYIPYLSTTDIFLQNEILSSESYIKGYNIKAGNNVTTTKPVGPVLIKNTANVILDADKEILLDKGFEVEKGAYFEVK